MAFRLPTFNLLVNCWDNPSQASNPPDRTFMANLSRGERHMTIGGAVSGGAAMPVIEMLLLCPPLTSVIGLYAGAFISLVEVPAASGRFYVVIAVDDVAKGFPNEYRNALIWQGDIDIYAYSGNPWNAPLWPEPFP
jgi:hypothetical protein